jgi:hypothetical protein
VVDDFSFCSLPLHSCKVVFHASIIPDYGCPIRATLASQPETAINTLCHYRAALLEYQCAIYRQYAAHHERDEVWIFFDRVAVPLNTEALICIYGPFNYNSVYTSGSNARFYQWLESQNILSCIKDSEDILLLAATVGIKLVNDVAMLANNRLLLLQNS